jgi:hypothetical protein
MRTRVFRILAGLLAVLTACFLTLADLSGRSLRELVGFVLVGVTFMLFALFGSRPADWWLGLWLGNPTSNHLSEQEPEPDEQSNRESPRTRDKQ